MAWVPLTLFLGVVGKEGGVVLGLSSWKDEIGVCEVGHVCLRLGLQSEIVFVRMKEDEGAEGGCFEWVIPGAALWQPWVVSN